MSSEVEPTGGRFDVRQSHLPTADAQVDGDASLVQLHSRLVDVLDDAIVATLRECPGDDRRDYRAVLDETIDALDGRLADALATLAHGVDPDADSAPAHAHRAAFHLLRGLGRSADGQQSTTDDVRALPHLLAATTSPTSTPTISVRLGVGWASRRKQQRSDVLRYLSRLSHGVDLRLVTSDAAERRILDEHVGDVPTSILTKLRNQRRTRRVHADDEQAERVDDALRDLNDSGRPAGILRALTRSVTDALDYDALADALVLDSPPYEAVRRLVDDGLVETADAADGRTVVSLLPAGRDAGEVFEAEHARSDGGSAASSASTSPDSEPAHNPPQNPTAMPCCPPQWDSPPGPTVDRDDPAPPPEAAESAADADRVERWHQGYVYPRWGDRDEWAPALSAANAGEVVLADAAIDERLAEDRDGRQAHVSFVEDDDAVVVGAEYHNPMQYATAVASGLLSERLMGSDDWADRIGDDLRGLDIHDRPLLWAGRCMGWLSSDVDDGEEYLDELTDAREILRDMSGEANREESETTRSSTTSYALGLIGTTVALFDLLGVEIVLEMRVPKMWKHYSRGGDEDRREDLLEHLGMLSALCSRVGAYSAFRQLFEDRPDRRADAFSPGFEDGGSGSMCAGIVVVGDGRGSPLTADEVAPEVAAPRPTHPDAPPISVGVDVVEEVSSGRTAAAVRRLLHSKKIASTRSVESAIAGFARSPWAAAEAVQRGLKSEDHRRDARLDEARTALSLLAPRQLLPSQTLSARRGVVSLLRAEEGISQAELARRSGFSSQTWRNHRDGLVDADIVRQTDSDEWRVALPFSDERDATDEISQPPWYLLAETARLGDRRDERQATDVLVWLLDERGRGDIDRMSDPSTDLGRAFEMVDRDGWSVPRGAVEPSIVADLLRDWGLPAGPLLAGCDGSPSTSRTSPARMGRSTRQTSLC